MSLSTSSQTPPAQKLDTGQLVISSQACGASRCPWTLRSAERAADPRMSLGSLTVLWATRTCSSHRLAAVPTRSLCAARRREGRARTRCLDRSKRVKLAQKSTPSCARGISTRFEASRQLEAEPRAQRRERHTSRLLHSPLQARVQARPLSFTPITPCPPAHPLPPSPHRATEGPAPRASAHRSIWGAAASWACRAPRGRRRTR